MDIVKCALAEKIGPAIVLKNNVRKTAATTDEAIVRKSSSKELAVSRTTTVYGFLDFTTTIDHTVVVFRPSTASSSSSSSSSSSTSSTSSSPSSSSTASSMSKAIRPTKARQMSTGKVSLPPAGRTRLAGPAIVMLGRASNTKPPSINPTPTLDKRNSLRQSDSGSTSGTSSNRRLVNSSSLSEKRRRFLALARRNRPTIKPKTTMASDIDDTTNEDVGQISQSPENDQEMAESIERTPSKVKRMYQALHSPSNYSTSTSGSGRILIRKLQRRLQGGSTADKNRQVLAFRRPNSKLNLLTGSGANVDVDVDVDVDEDNDKDLDDQPADRRPSLPSKNLPSDLSSSLIDGPNSSSVTGSDVTEYHERYQDVITEYSGSDSKMTTLQSSLIGSLSLDETDSSPSSGQLSEIEIMELTEPIVSSLDEVKTLPRLGPTVPLQLSIVTSSFSTTETRLRTSLLPVYDGKSTTFYTLTHSFVVTKTVSTFQTVPPEEYMHYLIPGHKNNESLDDLNDVDQSSSSLMSPSTSPSLQRKVDIEEYGDTVDEEMDELIDDSKIADETSKEHLEKAESNDAVKKVVDNNPGLSPMGQPNGGVNPALLGNLPYLNLLGPAALGLNPYLAYGLGIPQVLTTSRPIYSTDVIFTSKLVPIIDGLTTAYETLKEAASTVTRTSYETYVTTTGSPHGNIGGLMAANAAGLPGQGGGISIITQPHTFVTTETQLETQVFKLMYDGYKTSYRTVSSTQLITRTVTTHTTTTVPVYNTLQLPYFG